jgi:UDP-N-acetylglucosamine 4,6-dehydratase
MLNNKNILITGGSGSFGNRFVERIFRDFKPKKVIIYSRDEYKQYVMQQKFKNLSIQYIIGDVRDKERLTLSCKNVDIIIHAAALKHVPTLEYNPTEGIDTIIDGAKNVIYAAVNKNVEKIIGLSTDKAVYPINLYGAAKMISDKLFVNANSFSDNIFSLVRYGNVANSRGSVIPFFRDLKEKGINKFPITDEKMTRFWITLDEGIDLVLNAIQISKGTEIYVSKIPSFKIVDLANAMDAEIEIIGIRPGEKINECMITKEDSYNTFLIKNDNCLLKKFYVIYPNIGWWKSEKYFQNGKKVKPDFEYVSDKNDEWLNAEDLKKLLKNV